MNLDPSRRRVRDEIAHHLDELQEQLEAEGLSPEAARAEAVRRFGDPDRVARETPSDGSPRRSLRTFVDAFRQDLGFAVRQTRRSPGTSALTIGTVVIGVSATAIVFSIVHAVVLSPLPFANPDEVVHVSQTSPQGRIYSTSEPNFVDFRARQRSFSSMSAIGYSTPVLSGTGDAESIEGLRVSDTFFSLLGIEPVIGRSFTAAEDTFGGDDQVVILSEGAWLRRFAGDREILGRTIVLDGVSRRVIGVFPSGRAWPGVEVFVPLTPNPDVYRDDQRLDVIARLMPGVTLQAARADMSAIAERLSDEYPESNDGWGTAVRPAKEWRIGAGLSRLGGLLLGAVGLFLLMACASVSNLLLARASVRTREMGVRSALGAARGRITAQLLAEGVFLASIAGVLALIVSWQGLRLAQRFGPADIVRLDDASLGAGVLAVALLAALATVLLAGIAPVLLLRRSGAFAALRTGSASGAASGGRARDALVVIQFALAVAVVSGAGLLARSFVQLQEVDLGFEASGIVRFTVRLPDEQFDQASREDYLTRLADEISVVPGVRAVGATTAPPFSSMRPSNFVARSDREPDRQQDFLPVSWRAVTSGYFAAAGIPLLAGRVFDSRDRLDPGENVENPPVIIDRTLADLLWPDGEDPIGRLVTWFLPGGAQCEVVGVVASARDERLDVVARPRIYRPFTFSSWEQPALLVRTEGDPAELIPALRRVALSVDPAVPAIAPAPLSRAVSDSVAWPRFSMQVLTVFGLIALSLAAMGIYGVTAFAVSRRRHEIGVRVALGAEPSGVRWLLVRRALRLALTGIALGIAAALLLAGFLETILYDVSSNDPLTFVAVPAILLLVALASTWLPARKALRMDPREALVTD